MRSVNVAELKNRLSKYLRFAKGGEEVVIPLHRDKQISDLDKQGAVARLALLDRGWREVLPNCQVRDLAKQSLDKYSLRAADSLQLAASLIWRDSARQRGISYAEITV